MNFGERAYRFILQQPDKYDYSQIIKYLDDYQYNGYKLDTYYLNFTGYQIRYEYESFNIQTIPAETHIASTDMEEAIQFANKLDLESITGTISKKAISTEFIIDNGNERDSFYFLTFDIDNLGGGGNGDIYEMSGYDISD